MRRWIKIIICTLLLTVGVVVCVVRWQAWFGMPDEPVWTGDSLAYDFPTFGRDSVNGFVRTQDDWQDTLSPQSLDIVVLGDVHNRLSHADYDLIAARVPQADAIAQTGDWLDRGQYYYHQLLLREWTQSGLCGLPVIACPGNHEYSKGLHKTLLPEWNDWFPTPLSNPAVPGVFYYVDFPQLRFIVMDTNPLAPLVYRTRTLTWLRRAMNTAGNRYVVVMMHHPVLSTAKGRFNPGIYATFRYALGQADLVIAGHDHSYARALPFVELNSAGKPKPLKKDSTRWDVICTEPVYGVLSVKPTDMEFCVYRLQDGALIDSIYVDHH